MPSPIARIRESRTDAAGQLGHLRAGPLVDGCVRLAGLHDPAPQPLVDVGHRASDPAKLTRRT